ncbi:hypothetical protein NI17_024025 (plasmid) [Thermobifida halotolerans]|uniref:Uncharacterized protein n=1 Tax=Thermobifida halotolerans TaxID=483545 RepID=A0AA97M6H9_9ACTN|nr:hypothetical protein [Thermobifida halotolerans]UOE22283.1 hypothetical protein NI17_024025 [Thermobifida halotolerans]
MAIRVFVMLATMALVCVLAWLGYDLPTAVTATCAIILVLASHRILPTLPPPPPGKENV